MRQGFRHPAANKIEDSGGELRSGYSDYCPICGHLKVDKTVGGTDFDTTGWFVINNFLCLSVKCGHKWVEKFRISQ